MLLQKLDPCDLTIFDSICVNTKSNFLQSGFWGVFKSCFGWKAHYFLADKMPLLVLSRPLAAGLGFAYIPWGPQLAVELAASDHTANTALQELALALKQVLPKSTAFIRFDPPWFTAENGGSAWQERRLQMPFKHAAADIQAPDTVLIDLSPAEDHILAQMKSKCRYNIRLGSKKVKIRNAPADELPVFYEIFKETSRRDGIAIHNINYYATLFDTIYAWKNKNNASAPDIRLYLADYEGVTIAGIITLFWNGHSTYLYGASSNLHRNVMAPYALQWQAMRDAKACSCTVYDLFGIPPNGNSAHPMAGLYRFKTGFGGTIIHRPGSWDFAYKPILTAAFHSAEGLRKKIRDLKKQRC
ncbi:MAG: lipid II:glycine glycyltransferase FemX [Termitinemataceae bacterium]|nr:MAG: lipid II:glycine glycyltransferase FemX [Termitinemataceae bacterium]